MKAPDIADQVALVTGANGGMGLAAAAALADAGYRVAATDVTVDVATRELARFGERVAITPMDVTDAASIERAFSAIEYRWGRVDVCVNNAGILSYSDCETIDAETWRKVLAVNLDGVMFVSQRAVRGMKERGYGRIVNVASFAAKTGGLSPTPSYAASKGGVVSLTYSFARQFAPFGITCNAIAPAFVKTHMVTGHLSLTRQAELRKMIPVGRFCELEEFTHCVLFLAHPRAGFITGEVLDLNGGLQFD